MGRQLPTWKHRLLALGLALCTAGVAACASNPPAAPSAPPVSASDPSAPAIAGVAAQLDTHPLVMLGELHRSQEIHAFLQQLLHAPAFVCRIDDLVVEFGNARLQALADAYVAGGDVSDEQLQRVWRETAVPLTWNSPVYRQVFVTARAINRQHLCPRPLRILLGDPPLDWSQIRGTADYAPFTDRDGHYAQVVEREVLARGHRALLVAGAFHAVKRIPPDWEDDPHEDNVAQRIERRHPGALFSIVSIPLPAAAQALGMGELPSFRVVHGTDLEQADFQFTDDETTVARIMDNGRPTFTLTPAKHWPRMGEAVDGVLYLGGNHSLYPPPTIYLDPAYQQELRRRATIIKAYSGQDFLPVIDDLVRQAQATTPGG